LLPAPPRHLNQGFKHQSKCDRVTHENEKPPLKAAFRFIKESICFGLRINMSYLTKPYKGTKNMSTLIVNTLDKTKFFTSTSSYDYPRWVDLAEATKYVAPELADTAMKKLIHNGNYNVKLISLQEAMLEEAMSFEMPDDPDDQANPDNVDVAIDGQEDDSMVASDQEQVCPDCEHEPCTCEVSDEGSDEIGDEGSDEIDDDESDFSINGRSGNELDAPERPIRRESAECENEERTNSPAPFSKGQQVKYKGKEHTVLNDSGIGVVVISDNSDPKIKQRVIHKDITPITEDEDTVANIVTRITYANPSSNNNQFDQGGDPDDAKVAVPANVKAALDDVISMFDKATKNGTNDADTSFELTVASALSSLKDALNMGTVLGVKKAQIALGTMMSPITQHIPAVVLKFIHMGGAKPTLKDLFDDKRNPDQFMAELSTTYVKNYQKQAIQSAKDLHGVGKDGKAASRIRKVAGTIQKLKDKKAGVNLSGKHMPKAFFDESVDPESTYVARSAQVKKLLQQIQQHLDYHGAEFSRSGKGWAHPGDLAHVETQLQEILAFIKGEEGAE